MQKGYFIPLIVLVLVVGGVAWLAQYLPSTKTGPGNPDPRPEEQNLLAFIRLAAEWQKPPANAGADGTKERPAHEIWKYVETGERGHYDFFFKNKNEFDVEVASYASDCDCTSVKVCDIPAAEWDRLVKEQEAKPGEDLQYTPERWIDLHLGAAVGARSPGLIVKPGGTGAVRVAWVAKRTPGQHINTRPFIQCRRPGDTRLWVVQLAVPIKICAPVEFFPARVRSLPFVSGKSGNNKFDAWSATRDDFDLDLTSPDAHFEFKIRKRTKEECAALQATLVAAGLETRVRSACEVTMTVLETANGQQLDQGVFFRRWHVTLDQIPHTSLFGPEIVGRLRGEIQIGGADDDGRVRFISFHASNGSSKEIQLVVGAHHETAVEALGRSSVASSAAGAIVALAARAHVELELVPHSDTPSWIQVKLSAVRRKAGVGERTWSLKVTVPPNAPGARSFAEPDAVTLRILGATDRYVRIPLEGSISGQ